MFKISKGLGNLAEETLRFFSQIGVEEVAVPARFNENVNLRPLVPPAQLKAPGPLPPMWDEEELERIAAHVRAFDLAPTIMDLPLSGAVLLGRDGCDEDLRDIEARVQMAVRVGIEVLTYNFTALRASEGYAARAGAGRGGVHLRDFDYARIKELSPIDEVGEHGMDEMWERLEYFLKAIVPVAESAGVRLALHPNDPPVPVYRGVAQPLWNLAAMKRLIEVVDSPANSIFFDTGVMTEYGEDAAEAIRYFGARDRIGTVHFRNVRVEEPYYKYTETFVDEGDCDIVACMRAFAAVGYKGSIDPDHTPGITGDALGSQIGWSYAVGQLRALRAAALSAG
jgi:mannonate dehydratase